MRILQVANGYPPAQNTGVETYTYNLAMSLAGRGYAVHVLCRHSAHQMPDFEIHSEVVDGVPVTRLVNDFKAIGDFQATYHDARSEEVFQHIVDEFKPQLVHFNHLIGLTHRLPLLSSAAGIASVFTLHDFWPFCARINLVDWQGRQCGGPFNGGDCYTCMSGRQPGWQLRFLSQVKKHLPFELRQMLRKRVMMQGSKTTLVTMRPEDFPTRYSTIRQAILSAQSILATSEFVRSMYISNGYPAERIKVLPLGIEKPAISLAPKPARVADHGVTFAFVGSLIPAKGLDLLLRAFRRLQSPKARLLIYGEESSSPPEYHRKISTLARGDERIHFMGAFTRSQRTEVYQKMDVLVLPSRVPESFSLVAREALSLDRPVIAAEIGALPELIQPGVNGDLFPVEDEEALLLRLEKIVSQPDWLDTLKNAGLKTIYSMEEHTNLIESIYSEAIKDSAIAERK